MSIEATPQLVLRKLSWRTIGLLGFVVTLHVIVLLNLWGMVGDYIAQGAAVASAIPLSIAVYYLISRTVRPLSWLDIAVTFFGAYSLASVCLYAQPGNPSSVQAYVYGLYYFVLPMACYYAVKAVAPAEHRTLIAGLVFVNVFLVGYGIVLHLTRPAFYQDFVTQLLASKGYTETWQYYARLQSYLGSTTTGYVSATSIILVSLSPAGIRRWLTVLVPLFIAGACLSLERGSLIGCTLAMGYLLLVYRGDRGRKALMIGLAFGAAAYVTIRYADQINFFIAALQTRVTTDMVQGTSRLLTERGYTPAMRYLAEFPLGVGLGGTSSAAASAGLAHQGQVADANFMRIAADLGVIGLLMFLGLLATAAWSALHSRHRAAWLTFLCIHAGIMLSTNIFDSYYVSQSFWILLAILDADRVPVPIPVPHDVGEAPAYPAGVVRA